MVQALEANLRGLLLLRTYLETLGDLAVAVHLLVRGTPRLALQARIGDRIGQAVGHVLVT